MLKHKSDSPPGGRSGALSRGPSVPGSRLQSVAGSTLRRPRSGECRAPQPTCQCPPSPKEPASTP
eukprot:2589359-Rhodomonas_salina.3